MMEISSTQQAFASLQQFGHLLRQVTETVCEAGDDSLRFYQRDVDVTLKADHSPLTAADWVSHSFLVQALRDLTQELDILI